MELIKQMGLVQSGTMFYDTSQLGLNNGEQYHKETWEGSWSFWYVEKHISACLTVRTFTEHFWISISFNNWFN